MDFNKLAVFQLSVFFATAYGATPDAVLQAGHKDWEELKNTIRKCRHGSVPVIMEMKLGKLVPTPQGLLVPIQYQITVAVIQQEFFAIMNIRKIL